LELVKTKGGKRRIKNEREKGRRGRGGYWFIRR